MELRNIAIIAHVDHGKTTLVDAILKQTGVFRANEKVADRVLDSNDLERERGITILSKNTAVRYQGYKVNIVDTPGHADFGGEVERILSMVDGALLIVDAFEGPMPQTRFVVQKALAQGLRPILVVNKIDRPDSRPLAVVDEVLDLFIDLGADDEQLEFPVLYASAKVGVAHPDLEEAQKQVAEQKGSVYPLLDQIIAGVPGPKGDEKEPLQLLVTTLDWDDYLGRIAIGRVENGILNKGQEVILAHGDQATRSATVTHLFAFENLKRVPVEQAAAGEIVAVAGVEGIEIGDTICLAEKVRPLPPLKVDEPTLSMVFRVNDSPFAGREGQFLTSRQLKDRLWREAKMNVALRVAETDSPEAFTVSGRGELHLGILIETMRREGYEFSISRPQVITRQGREGLLEPLERLVADVPQDCMGTIMEKLGIRKGELVNMAQLGADRVRMEFVVPARGLIGFNSEFLTDTKGRGIMYHSFSGYGAYRGEVPHRTNGVLVAWEAGVATAFAIVNIQERGTLFITPGTEVYEGMIIGENSRDEDLDVNIAKKKHVTNMRSAHAEIAPKIDTPRQLSLEQALAYIADDELVEVTPRNIRLRKKILDKHQRHALRKNRSRVS